MCEVTLQALRCVALAASDRLASYDKCTPRARKQGINIMKLNASSSGPVSAKKTAVSVHTFPAKARVKTTLRVERLPPPRRLKAQSRTTQKNTPHRSKRGRGCLDETGCQFKRRTYAHLQRRSGIHRRPCMENWSATVARDEGWVRWGERHNRTKDENLPTIKIRPCTYITGIKQIKQSNQN